MHLGGIKVNTRRIYTESFTYTLSMDLCTWQLRRYGSVVLLCSGKLKRSQSSHFTSFCFLCIEINEGPMAAQKNSCFITTATPGPDPIKIFSASMYSNLEFKHSDWLLKFQ